MKIRPCSVLGLMFGLAMTGCSPASSSTLPSALPDELSFRTISAPDISSTEYRLTRDGVLVKTSEGPLVREGKTLRRRVPAQAWQAFVERVTPLQPARWKHEYTPDHRIFDGLMWELRWSSGSLHVQSEGRNAFPAADDPAKTVEIGARGGNGMKLFRDALTQLWENSAAVDTSSASPAG